jgi:phosphatidylserine/phosphatidylglycerophosphate/cardiolipin synthase-like enzyme
VLPLLDLPPTSCYATEVAARIRDATESIDILLSSGRLEGVSLWEALCAAADRGVDVRLLIDSSNWAPAITAGNAPLVEALRERGIDARFDDPEITTHAKLVILDQRIVVVGSANWNRYALTEHRQAGILIDDPAATAPFVAFFERLWSGDLPPGGICLPDLPPAEDGAMIVPLPDTVGTALCATFLLDALEAAQRSVHIVMYRMSYYGSYPTSLSNALLDALVSASARGLDVRVVLDDCSFYPDSLRANLEAALWLHFQGVDVRLDPPAATTHAKLVILDGETVVLGSTNWNYYALERNVEASVAILRAPAVAAPFEAFFERLWEEARPLPR